MSQEEEDDEPLPAQSSHCTTCTESEASDDVCEASDMTHRGATSLLTGRKRRRRTIIAADQLMKMEELYKQEQWPGREKKESLAREIGMSTHFVNIWFQNKRSRMKKLAQEEEELEFLRKARSPGSKVDPVHGSSTGTKPIAIAPKPPFGKTVPSNQSPIAAIRIPQVGPCLVLGQNISMNGGASPISSSQVTGSPVHPSPTIKIQNGTSSSTKNSGFEATATPSSPVLFQPQPMAVNAQLTQLPMQAPTRPLNFFKCLVSMMAVEEGGLLKRGNPEFDVAVNAALYGLRMANGNVLTYRKNRGLFIHNDQH
ncbi:protein gooseberry-like isoform X2 [Acanthaster planci]|uniref:Protein gooseberry-like isoform X2 n=1 Tax=Acanthaster planci TaxID=133434 RepID=A0A8B7XKW7_ACAPL|nr:protein gooseberry-like isoform X2 [Acanthaster planci]